MPCDFLFLYFFALNKKAENFLEVVWKEIKLSSSLDTVSGRDFSCISFKGSAAACCFKKYPKF